MDLLCPRALGLEDDLGTAPKVESRADRAGGHEGRGSANDSENRKSSPNKMT